MQEPVQGTYHVCKLIYLLYLSSPFLSSNVLFLIEPATDFIITHYIYKVMSINVLCLRAENT